MANLDIPVGNSIEPSQKQKYLWQLLLGFAANKS